MCFNEEDISPLKGGSLKLLGKFMYLASKILSTESDINMRVANALSAKDRLSLMWMSDLSDKIKRNFFQAIVE